MSIFATNSTALANNGTSSTNSPGLDLPASGARITAFIVIFMFCLLGNCLLIAVVYKNANQRMRTPSNYFILNMACADILLVVYLVPQNSVVTAFDMRWLIGGVEGEILCRLSLFVGQITVLVSTGSLFFIALDRYFLVFYPLKRLITLQTTRRIIAAVWIIATVFTAPLLAMSALFEVSPGFLICNVDIISFTTFVVPYFLFCYITLVAIPLLIIIVLYIAIGFKINRAAPPGNQLPSTQERRERMTHKVLAMLVTIVAALILFRLPLIIFLMACVTGSHLCSKFHVADFIFVAWIFTFINSSVNPWIYFIFNKQFRHGAKLIVEKFFPCCFKAGNGVDAIQDNVRQMDQC